MAGASSARLRFWGQVVADRAGAAVLSRGLDIAAVPGDRLALRNWFVERACAVPGAEISRLDNFTVAPFDDAHIQFISVAEILRRMPKLSGVVAGWVFAAPAYDDSGGDPAALAALFRDPDRAAAAIRRATDSILAGVGQIGA